MNPNDSKIQIGMMSHNPASEQNYPPPPSYQEFRAFNSGNNNIQPPNSDLPYLEPMPNQAGVPCTLAQSNVGYQPKFQTGTNGIETDDSVLNKDKDALLDFFIKNCTPPRMKIRIYGYHMVTVRHTDSKGKSHTRQERRTDFDLYYDLSPLISPIGTIYAIPDKDNVMLTVPEIIQRYIATDNTFKSLTLRKHPVWDYHGLTNAIVGAIRANGYFENVEVTFPMENHKMTIESDSGLNKARRSTVTKIFCILSCLWVFAYPIFLMARKKYDGTLRADFQMGLTAEQWFSMNYWQIRGATGSKNQCAVQ